LATAGTLKNSALVVVDAQAGVMKGAFEATRIVNNISEAVSRARQNQVPVFWIQHSDEELVKDSEDWQLVSGLKAQENELIIEKNFNSAFENTTLGSALSNMDIGHIVLAGAATNWCIRATAYGALEWGYDLTLLGDAHTTKDMDPGEGVVVTAVDLIRDLNTTIKWLSYPGRTNDTMSFEAYRF